MRAAPQLKGSIKVRYDTLSGSCPRHVKMLTNIRKARRHKICIEGHTMTTHPDRTLYIRTYPGGDIDMEDKADPHVELVVEVSP